MAATPDEVAEALNVSRETFSRLKAFIAILGHWQKSTRLVAGLDNVWQRHILDCGQIFPHIAGKTEVMDLGAGAGLPGLVLAVMAAEKSPGTRFRLVEANTRKCAFLAAAAREVGVKAEIINDRVAAIPKAQPDIITARAVAPLEKLLEWASRHAGNPAATCLFFKGAQYHGELTALENYPNIGAEILPSVSDPAGVIIRIRGLTTQS